MPKHATASVQSPDGRTSHYFRVEDVACIMMENYGEEPTCYYMGLRDCEFRIEITEMDYNNLKELMKG